MPGKVGRYYAPAMVRSIVAAFVVAACSAPAQHDAVRVPEPDPSPPPQALPSLPPLTAEERAVDAALARELEPLLALGERAFSEDGMVLATVTDHVAARLEAFGYELKRRGFAHGETIAQNLEVEVPGLRRGNQLVVVTARLDSEPGSPAADDATGIAALLVLAQRFHSQRALRTVRFAFLSSAGPHDQPQARGAFHYAKALAEDQKPLEDEESPALEVVATVELAGLARYDDTPGSQRYPEAVVPGGTAGNFVALVSQPESNELASAAGQAFEAAATLPFSQWVVSKDDALLVDSATGVFAQQGFRTLLFTDTRGLRSSDVGTASDDVTRLDRDRLARVVTALEPALIALSGPRGAAAEPNVDGLAP